MAKRVNEYDDAPAWRLRERIKVLKNTLAYADSRHEKAKALKQKHIDSLEAELVTLMAASIKTTRQARISTIKPEPEVVQCKDDGLNDLLSKLDSLIHE